VGNLIERWDKARMTVLSTNDSHNIFLTPFLHLSLPSLISYLVLLNSTRIIYLEMYTLAFLLLSTSVCQIYKYGSIGKFITNTATIELKDSGLFRWWELAHFQLERSILSESASGWILAENLNMSMVIPDLDPSGPNYANQTECDVVNITCPSTCCLGQECATSLS